MSAIHFIKMNNDMGMDIETNNGPIMIPDKMMNNDSDSDNNNNNNNNNSDNNNSDSE
jgi:hypothetical protein